MFCVLLKHVPIAAQLMARGDVDGFSLDYWALGVVLWMLHAQTKLYDTANELDDMFRRVLKAQQLPALVKQWNYQSRFGPGALGKGVLGRSGCQQCP